jgi:hypothetical protein
MTRSRVPLIAMLALATTIGIAGCSGDDGKNGAAGPTGPSGSIGPTGPTGPTGPSPTADPIASANPESCITCHGSAGSDHQAVYADYLDAKTKSQFKISIEDVTGDGKAVSSVPAVSGLAGRFDVTLEVKITKNGLPFNDSSMTGTNPNIQLGSLPQKRFAIQGYFPTATYKFQDKYTAGLGANVTSGDWKTQTGYITLLADGKYLVKNTNVQFDPLAQAGWQAYAYVAAGVLETEGMTLYADVADDGLAFGTAVDAATKYASTAVVSGCEACHGAPYLKHGYRAAVVDGLSDFAACKECHFDDRTGGHLDWQWMVDQPYEWATLSTKTPAQGPPDPTKYAYKASVMQDTHQTHAMEFPYPMSMANCTTCHKGKLDAILTDANFKVDTCKSCHPVDGKDAWGTVCTDASSANTPCYAQANRAPALKEMWADSGTTSFHSVTAVCGDCHKTGGVGSTFKKYHSGYDKAIYNSSGQRYSDLNKITIDSVTLVGNALDIKFSSANTAIVPELTVSFYGYDAKQMLVSSHTRDGGAKDCSANTCRFEIVVDGNPVSAANANRLFAVQADSKPGAWHVQALMDKYVQPRGTATGSTVNTGLDSIPTLITQGKVKKAEIVVLPELLVGGEAVAVNAATYTFDLVGKAKVANYYQGTNAIVDAAKCNLCHDALGTTFHDPGYGGNVTVCRTCHVTTSAGGHLEMQSRGIDSYVHAIHRFQYFDTGSVDFTNPVFAKRYQLHVEHGFPNFTIKNCEACHAKTSPANYNPPDNAKSMPGLESVSYTLTKGWVDLTTGASLPTGKRQIGNIPQYVVGPANRACGGCHRGILINEDAEGELVSFNSHTSMGGYTIKNGTTATGAVDYVYAMIEKMMNYYK